eukprot:63376-Rhodomonas_salina.2
MASYMAKMPSFLAEKMPFAAASLAQTLVFTASFWARVLVFTASFPGHTLLSLCERVSAARAVRRHAGVVLRRCAAINRENPQSQYKTRNPSTFCPVYPIACAEKTACGATAGESTKVAYGATAEHGTDVAYGATAGESSAQWEDATPQVRPVLA